MVVSVGSFCLVTLQLSQSIIRSHGCSVVALRGLQRVVGAHLTFRQVVHLLAQSTLFDGSKLKQLRLENVRDANRSGGALLITSLFLQVGELVKQDLSLLVHSFQVCAFANQSVYLLVGARDSARKLFALALKRAVLARLRLQMLGLVNRTLDTRAGRLHVVGNSHERIRRRCRLG